MTKRKGCGHRNHGRAENIFLARRSFQIAWCYNKENGNIKIHWGKV